MKNQNFRDELKKIVSKDINEFFEEYANRILANSKESNLVISIKGRFRELKNQEIKGIISNEEYSRELNKIRSSLLDLIDQIESSSYIPNFDSNEIGKIIIQLNNNSLKSDELIKEQSKQIESLNYRTSNMQQEIDKLRLKILERSILSIDTQDANMESYFMAEYIRICQKKNNSILKYETDEIVNAVEKYSKKYPNLMESEKLTLIEELNKLKLNVVNKKKLQNIMENFKLK